MVLYGAEVGGMSTSHMKDVRISACSALGKGASLRRSSPLELMAYGGPAGDPQAPADLNMILCQHKRLPSEQILGTNFSNQLPLPLPTNPLGIIASWAITVRCFFCPVSGRCRYRYRCRFCGLGINLFLGYRYRYRK
eukprot:66713-Amphidinium_carterae.3